VKKMDRFFDNVIKIIFTLIFAGALILVVLPTIFWTSIKIVFELVTIIIYLFLCYIFMDAIRRVWTDKKVK